MKVIYNETINVTGKSGLVYEAQYVCEDHCTKQYGDKFRVWLRIDTYFGVFYDAYENTREEAEAVIASKMEKGGYSFTSIGKLPNFDDYGFDIY